MPCEERLVKIPILTQEEIIKKIPMSAMSMSQ